MIVYIHLSETKNFYLLIKRFYFFPSSRYHSPELDNKSLHASRVVRHEEAQVVVLAPAHVRVHPEVGSQLRVQGLGRADVLQHEDHHSRVGLFQRLTHRRRVAADH